MGNVSQNTLKKYVAALSKMKAKYVTSERLSKVVGIYPEIISDHLSMFDPMIKLDPSYNLMELIPDIKKYLNDLEAKKTPDLNKISVSKKEVEEYSSVMDFFYKKLTIGGMIDSSHKFDKKELMTLKRIINEELKTKK